MSYSRLSGTSDVYVFASRSGVLHCHWCALGGDDAHEYSVRQMLTHLQLHRRSGHKVPLECDAWILLDALHLSRVALCVRRIVRAARASLARSKA